MEYRADIFYDIFQQVQEFSTDSVAIGKLVDRTGKHSDETVDDHVQFLIGARLLKRAKTPSQLLTVAAEIPDMGKNLFDVLGMLEAKGLLNTLSTFESYEDFLKLLRPNGIGGDL